MIDQSGIMRSSSFTVMDCGSRIAIPPSEGPFKGLDNSLTPYLMDGRETLEVALAAVNFGCGFLNRRQGSVADPSGHQHGCQQRRAKDADPQAELGGEIAEVTPRRSSRHHSPDERTQRQNHDQNAGQSQ